MWHALLRNSAAAAALVLGVVMLLVGYDVVARNLGFWSPAWILDATEYALPLATLLVAPWLTAQSEHIRVDLLSGRLPKLWSDRLNRLISATCSLVSAIVTWSSVGVLIEAYETNGVIIKSVIFPEWYVYVLPPLSFAAITIECFRQTINGSLTSLCVDSTRSKSVDVPQGL